MASYPNSIYSPRAKENKAGVVYDPDKKTILFVEDINNSDAETTAIETELGTLPKGAKADVKTRLNDVDTALGNRYTKAEADAEFVTPTETVTFTNKRITARVQSVVTAATVTPNVDSNDTVDITALAQAVTIANPGGTPTNFQKFIIRIKDNGTARAITWGNGYSLAGIDLPTVTILSKILLLGFIYNTANALNKWQLVALTREA